jgi:hypothetical protein
MSDEKNEISESGAPIFRHALANREFTAPEVDDDAKERFEQHIEEHIGNIAGVFHEIVSDLVHIDVYHVLPTDEKPYHTLITHGMSDMAMNAPENAMSYRYAELMCQLPPSFDFSDNGIEDEKNYWALGNVNLTGLKSRASKIFTIVPNHDKLPHHFSSKTVRFIAALSGYKMRLEYCPLSK